MTPGTKSSSTIFVRRYGKTKNNTKFREILPWRPALVMVKTKMTALGLQRPNDIQSSFEVRQAQEILLDLIQLAAIFDRLNPEKERR